MAAAALWILAKGNHPEHPRECYHQEHLILNKI
jgi:hypothetical protein